MRVIYRNINDLDEVIRKYEEKHGISSVEMLKDQAARQRIAEVELLKWEAYLTQRRRLLDHNNEVRREYLRNRNSAKTSKHSAKYDPIKYAA